MRLIRTEDAVGHVLCHDLTQIIPGVVKGPRFRKGHIVTEEMKNDIAIAQRLGITATTLEGILTVKGQGKRRRG